MDDMFGGVNASAKGSVEASVIKTGNISLNFAEGVPRSAEKDGILGSMRTVFRAKGELQVYGAELDWDLRAAKRIKADYPSWSDERCLMEARGYRMTDAQAKNIADVSKRAMNELEVRGSTSDGLDDEQIDSIVEGAKGAYADEARALWSALLANEIDSGKACSKRTMRILGEMEAAEASLFCRLCQYCAGENGDKRTQFYTYPLVFIDEGGISFNEGAFSYSDLAELETAGLIKLKATTYFDPRESPLLRINGATYGIVGSDSRISVGNLILTPCGEELSTLCELGTADGLVELFDRKMAAQNAALIQLPDEMGSFARGTSSSTSLS